MVPGRCPMVPGRCPMQTYGNQMMAPQCQYLRKIGAQPAYRVIFVTFTENPKILTVK